MTYSITTATKKIRKLNKRIRVVQGGSSASKTISILLYLIDLAQRDTTPTLTSIVSESLPHLRQGAMLDFLNIMQQHNYFADKRWYKSHPATYTFETGSKIEFFSIDQPRKVRGPRRDRLFINEANNTPFESFEQLEIRTKEFVILDYNPTTEFWATTEVMKRDDAELLILTYKDNEALDPQIIASLEMRKDRKGWWQVYGLGQLGEVENKIYKGWVIVDEIPEGARLERRGLDYGYTTDPTAIVDVYKYNGGYVLDEMMYRKGMQNKEIADVLKGFEDCLVIPDSSEPKSNDELVLYDISLLPAIKGPGSVRYGIQLMQSVPIWITKRSVHGLKEYRNYLWMTDRNGKVISPNEPEPGLDHFLDAARYAISSLNPHIADEDEEDEEPSTPRYADIGI